MYIMKGEGNNIGFLETDGVSYNLYCTGCSIRCPECHNKEMWNMKSGINTPISDIVEDIKSNLELIDNICILGGEPTDQEEDLLELLETLNDLSLGIWLYTGKPEELILKSEIYNYCNIIKVGEYDDTLAKEGTMLASSNQKFIPGGRKPCK